jgi:hypothetical protein
LRIAEIALRQRVTPDEILRPVGIRENAAGYREEVYRKGLMKLREMRNHVTRLETIERWVWNSNEIRFKNLGATAVGAAIEPFGDTMPGKDLRDRFLSFALNLLGDPRVNALRWQGCLGARDIACRWLTEQSLRQFFEVVGRVAKPEHWNYRHAFWNALYEKNYIHDAWVVFDRYGAAEARRMFQGEISFATFNETVQQGHAVLLLRIGSLIIAEWSHTGSCRVWDTSTGESGPQLYKNRYSKFELQAQDNPEGVFRHSNPTAYLWQRRIAEYLRLRCNIVLSQTDYQVR